jgi:hypothetical protein
MSTIRGTIQDGQVILSAPADLPNGTPVAVNPLPPAAADELPDDDDASPEAIARRLALMDRVQPWMTPEEEAAWKKQREEDKAAELAQWDARSRKLEGLFE